MASLGPLSRREEPEMFVQDNPLVGQVFSSDNITFKMRHEYGGTSVAKKPSWKMRLRAYAWHAMRRLNNRRTRHVIQGAACCLLSFLFLQTFAYIYINDPAPYHPGYIHTESLVSGALTGLLFVMGLLVELRKPKLEVGFMYAGGTDFARADSKDYTVKTRGGMVKVTREMIREKP